MQRTQWAPIAAGLGELAVIGVIGAIVTDSPGIALGLPAAIVGLAAVHEFSQAYVGRALGFEITSIRMGSGPVVLRAKFAGAPINVRAFPVLGAMDVVTIRADGLRKRAAMFALAGIGGVLLVALFLALFVGNPGRLSLGLAVLLSAANLIPGSLMLATREVDNDGLVLLRILTESKASLERRWLHPGFLRQFRRALRRHDAAAALNVAVNATSYFPNDPRWSLARAHALARINPQAAQRELLPLVGIEWADAETTTEFALVCNAVAFHNLRAGTRGALPLAREAARLRPDDHSAATTFAFGLVEEGLTADALDVLTPLLTESMDPGERANALCVHAMALVRIGANHDTQLAINDAASLDPASPLLARAREAVGQHLAERAPDALPIRDEPGLEDLLQQFAEIHDGCDIDRLVATGRQLVTQFPDQPIARLEYLHAQMHADPLRHLDSLEQHFGAEPSAGWPRLALGCAAGQAACALLGSGDRAAGLMWARRASALTGFIDAVDAWALAANGYAAGAHEMLDQSEPPATADIGWAHQMLVRAAAYAELGDPQRADALIDGAARVHTDCQWLPRYLHFVGVRRRAYPPKAG